MKSEEDGSLATIISIFPRKLVEHKPGIQPSEYVIPAGNPERPGLLIINDNVFYLMNPDPLSDGKDVPSIRVPVRAMEMAQSIIMDYVNALISVETGKCPGIFCVKGGFEDSDLVKVRFHKEIEIYYNFQLEWFKSLVLMGDEIWKGSRSLAGISDLQREACRSLRLDREWLVTTQNAELIKCRFCTSLVSNDAIVCPACHHVLNQEKYKSMNPVVI